MKSNFETVRVPQNQKAFPILEYFGNKGFQANFASISKLFFLTFLRLSQNSATSYSIIVSFSVNVTYFTDASPYNSDSK